jgi:gliding motility-associated-like protein
MSYDLKVVFIFLLIVLSTESNSQSVKSKKVSDDKFQFVSVKTLQPVNDKYWDEIENLSNGYFKVKLQGKYAITDFKGALISSFFYDAIGDFSNRRIPVKKNNQWGYLNEKGENRIQNAYEAVSPFKSHVAAGYKNKRWYLFDTLGTLIKILDIDHFGGFFQKKAKVFKDGKTGFINEQGDLLPPGWVEEKIKNSDVYRTSSTNANCPPNIGFEDGTLNQWQCFIGNAQAVGTQNVITMVPATPVAPVNNRHQIIARANPAALDFYGNFPLNPPDGSNFAIKLGNTLVGAEAERIRYPVNVPASATSFFVVFNYAVVYEEPVSLPHESYEHPRFTARLFDPVSNSVEECANFDFNSSVSTGFIISPILSNSGQPVLYRPWQSVFINLSKYAGRTVFLEFTTADCTRTGHWGYAYVDVEDCDLSISAQNVCTSPQRTILTGPSGFNEYKWWNSNFTILYGQGRILSVQPSLPINSIVKLELTPVSGARCKDTLTLSVRSPQFTIELGNDKTICEGDTVSLGINARPNSTYTWSPNIRLTSNNQPGVGAFPVTTTKYYLRVRDNATGCEALDSITVKVNPKPSLNANSTQVCPGQSATLTVSGADTYTWTPATYLNTTTGASVISTPTSGITYIITGRNNTTGCSNRTFSAVRLNSNPNVNVNSDSACRGTPVLLTAIGGDTYRWSPSAGLSSTTGSSVNATPNSTTIYTVIGTNSTTGCSDTAQAIVTVKPLPPIRVNSGSICQGGQIRLIASGGISYAWSPASTLSAAIGDTVVASPSVTTKYFVTGTSSINNCVNKDSAIVIVNPNPVLSIDAPPICIGETSVLVVTGADSYQWDPSPTLNTLTGNRVLANPAVTTTYSLTGRINSTGCTTYTSARVVVYPLPVGVININGNNQFICDGSYVELIGSGGSTYQWNYNGSAISGAVNPVYRATREGSYSLSVVSPQGCRSSTPAIVFSVLKKPDAAFRAPVGCVGNQFSFTNQSATSTSGPVKYLWQFGNGSTSNARDPIYTYVAPGTYNVVLRVAPDICPALFDTTSKLVFVDAPRKGLRYTTVNAISNSNTQLAARSFGSVYSWLPQTGLNNPSVSNPVYNFNRETDYTIRITTPSGCITYDSVLVRIFSKGDIQVPKAFTPNGDGNNDLLDVFLIGIKELRFFRVYNRWGQLMFETKSNLQLWNGKYKNIDQPLETYVWIAEGVAEDGTVITKRGQTILIR